MPWFLMAVTYQESCSSPFLYFKMCSKVIWIYFEAKKERAREKSWVTFLMTSARHYFLKVSVPLMMLITLFFFTTKAPVEVAFCVWKEAEVTKNSWCLTRMITIVLWSIRIRPCIDGQFQQHQQNSPETGRISLHWAPAPLQCKSLKNSK